MQIKGCLTLESKKKIENTIKKMENNTGKNFQKIFGMTPMDYRILKATDKIDASGALLFEERAKNDDEDEDDDEFLDLNMSRILKKKQEKKKQQTETLIDQGVNTFLENLIISRSNSFYKFEQGFISFISVITGYVYMYFSAFGAHSQTYQIFELFYFFDMVLNFFVEYKSETRTHREFHLIMINYIKTDFLGDLLPLLPLEMLQLNNGNERHFFLLKVLRIRKGYKLLSIKDLISEVKKYYQ